MLLTMTTWGGLRYGLICGIMIKISKGERVTMRNIKHLTVFGPDGTYAATRGYYLHELVEK